MAQVEDTKAGKYDKGRLLITTLRVMWMSHTSGGINLSVGLNNVTRVDSKGRGQRDVKALVLITKSKTNSFEFIFTPATQEESIHLIWLVENLVRVYRATSSCRELRLRANITQNSPDGQTKDLILLPGEEVHEKVSGVMNLSQDRGQIGCMWITNLRVVWTASLQENFNCSVPYLQVKQARVRSSKFGMVLVIETWPETGKYLLGFQIAPKERLNELMDRIGVLLQMSRDAPFMGLSAADLQEPVPLSQDAQDQLQADENTPEDSIASPGDGLAAYYAHGLKGVREPVFDSSIGLTIEAMPEDVTIQSLWSVL